MCSSDLQRSARFVGRQEQVLVEGVNPRDAQQLMGRTRSNRLTFFAAETERGHRWQMGDLVPVRIDTARPFSLSGKALDPD